ncbi:hypothetical protein PO909_002636 [Leuciscus waleckii]
MLFENIGYIKYAFFSLGIILYCAIIFLNAFIIIAICLERTLHLPMYILISCLSINSVFGTAAFFPRLLTDLLSDTHLVSREACLLQAFVIYSYASNENTILMLMAFDRYVAICKPLQYNSIMTPRILSVLIAISWIYPMLCIVNESFPCVRKMENGTYFYFMLFENLGCIRYAFFTLGFIFYCAVIYFNVLIVLVIIMEKTLHKPISTREFRSKAYKTCIPHMVILLNFSVAIFCELTLSRFMNGELPIALSVIISLEFIVIPPFVNPIVYGLNFPDIRKKIRHLIKASK